MEIPKNYSELEGLNQSKLKRILEHPKLFIEDQIESEFDEPKDHIDIGDAVDLLLTGDERKFHETFAVSEVERPTGKMGDFCWAKFKYRDFDNADQLAYVEAEIKMPKTVEAYLEKFEKEGRAYYNELVNNEGKRVLTPKKNETIIRIVEAIRNNPSVYQHIDPTNEAYEIYFQVPISWKWELPKTRREIWCKGLADVVKVHKETRMATIIDVKTTRYSVGNFHYAFYTHRYDFQAAWYYVGLLHDFETKQRLNIKGVDGEVLFVVGSSKFPDQCLVQRATKKVLGAGWNGYILNGKIYEGVGDALERYDFHTEIDKWDYKAEEYLNEFNVEIPFNGELNEQSVLKVSN